jgi:regulator of replication initiation timing
MSRRCECEARMAGECMCGAWDDDSKWLQPGVDAELDQLRADRDRLAAEVERLKKTEKFLRYYECSDVAIAAMTDKLLAAVEDTTFEGDVENLVMNLEQLRKQREEARHERDSALSSAEALRVECERMRAVCEAAKALYEADQVDAMSDGGLVPQCRETHDKLSALYAAVDATAKGTGDE